MQGLVVDACEPWRHGSKPIALFPLSTCSPSPLLLSLHQTNTHRSKDVMKLVYGRDEGVAQRAVDVGH